MRWQAAGPGWLFCPADRPDRYTKAANAADMVILDLEDAVASGHKDAARTALATSELDPARTIVRINPTGTDDFDKDLRTVADTAYRTLMLPKCESADEIALLSGYSVVALIETPTGALNAREILAALPVVAAMWGAEDLIAAIGGDSSRQADGTYRAVAQHVRSQVLLAAAATGCLPVDSVYLDIGDLPGLAAEAEDAVAVGFGAKAAIHPSQIRHIRAAYRPGKEQVLWAQRVLAVAGFHRGVFTFEGHMIDEPLLRHAERVMVRAGTCSTD